MVNPIKMKHKYNELTLSSFFHFLPCSMTVVGELQRRSSATQLKIHIFEVQSLKVQTKCISLPRSYFPFYIIEASGSLTSIKVVNICWNFSRFTLAQYGRPGLEIPGISCSDGYIFKIKKNSVALSIVLET